MRISLPIRQNATRCPARSHVLSSAATAGFLAVLLAGPAGAQLLIDQNRQDRQTQPEDVAPTEQIPESRIVDVQEQADGAPLTEVVVEGSSASADQFVPIWTPFLGRTLDEATITEIANAVSAAYEESGAAIYTVVAPAQDLSQGVLTLTVIEGYIEQVQLLGDVEGRDLSLVQAYAQKLTEQRPLLRSTLERYLSLIRDIPGVTVDAQFLNGEARGATRLALTLSQKRFDYGSSLNMSGSEILGRTQISANVEAYGLLRQGDRTSLSLMLPTNFENFFYVSGAHSTPIGADGLRAQIRGSYLETSPEALPITGHATTAALELNYPLLRSYEENIFLFAGVDMLDSSNAVLGNLLSSEETRNVRLGASWNKSTAKTFATAGATLSGGVDALGADVNPLIGEEGYLKLTLNGAYNRALSERVVLRLAAGGQIAGTDLPQSERYSLGGQLFGRAFSSASVLGDDAAAGSLELAWLPAWAPAPLAGSELYVFADHARAWTRERFLTPAFHADLTSAGAGVRLSVRRKHSLGLEFARALEAPAPIDDHSWRVMLSWNIRS